MKRHAGTLTARLATEAMSGEPARMAGLLSPFVAHSPSPHALALARALRGEPKDQPHAA